MRRIVRDYVLAALERQQSDVEHFVSTNLEVPDAFPFLSHALTVRIREIIGRVRITPRTEGDFPEVEVIVVLHAAVAADWRKREPALGVRTATTPDRLVGAHALKIDVELSASAAPIARGYRIVPQRARVGSWWGDLRG